MSQPRAGRPVAVAALLCLLTACSPSGGPRVGGQTNWLRVCQVDADCDGLECLCGACVMPCDDNRRCDEPGASCFAAEATATVAFCSGEPPPSPGLCLSRCKPGTCGAGTACIAGVCSPVGASTAQIAIDPDTEHQVLVGFGADLGFMEDEIATHPASEALFDAMFADSGFDMVRLRNRFEGAGTDLSSSSDILQAAAVRLGRPVTTYLTEGSPPPALKANGDRLCDGNVETCTLVQLGDGGFDYPGLASHWRASVDAYSNEGIRPDYLSIQNNPNWIPAESDPTEACRFLPTEGTASVTIDGSPTTVTYPGYAEAFTAVLSALEGLTPTPKMAAPEVSSFDAIDEYAAELNIDQVDALSHHIYGIDPGAIDTQALEDLGRLGQDYQRPLLQTEMRADGFATAVLIHHVLVTEGASAYLQNDFAASAFARNEETQPLIALDTEGFTLKDPYHAMRHFARYTDPGWVRLDASSPTGNLLASAWMSPDEDAVTVVLVNAGLTDITAELDFSDLSSRFTTTEVIRTTFEGLERFTSLGSLPPEGVVRMPGHAMATVTFR